MEEALVLCWWIDSREEGKKEKKTEKRERRIEATSFFCLVCLLASFVIVCLAEQVSIVIEQLQKLNEKKI